MHFARFQRTKFKFVCVLILFQLITRSNGSPDDISCSITTHTDKDIKTSCQSYQENSGCPVEQFHVKEEIGNPKTVITGCNDTYCDIEISVTFFGRGTPILLINGYDLQGEQVCVQIIFSDLKTWKGGEIEINSANIKLPYGPYWLTAYLTSGKGKQFIFARKSLTIWNRRQKRSQNCLMIQCSFYKYQFIGDTGLLRFFFTFEDSGTCDKDLDNKVTLLKLLYESDPMTEEKCSNYNNTDDHDIISRAVRYRKAMEISDQSVIFSNIETGCYVLRARPGCYFGFFWFNSTNLADLNKWNTSILLMPRENQRSLQVQWDWPVYPFNFTGWKLKLWKMENHPVQCNGQNPMDKKLTTMAPSSVLNTNYYTFINLTAGYYCVRLGGIDDRCPDDGCQLRSSATVFFDPSRSEQTVKKPMSPGIPIILLVVAAVIVGICFTLLCFRYNWTSKKTTLQYELVADKANQLGTTSVLLIWTKYTPINSPSPEPLIQVLKRLLRNHYCCQVYDYLDPLSLPKEQCRQLMSDPTSWLSSQLRKSDMKIIIVASEGAYWRQQELNPDKGTNLAASLTNPLDKNLFPYVLNFLKESFKLSADYSRVFQVCFPDIYGHGMELDGLVDSARYNMPEHIQELAYRIQGAKDCTTCLMRDPENGELDELNQAITILKHLNKTDI